MDRSTFGLVLLSVLMSASAQIVLKAGMSSGVVASAAAGGPGLALLRAVATQPQVVGGLCIYFASAAVWLLVLARVDVGLAYPFVGLGFIVTLLLAWAFRGEAITVAKLAGTLLICAGVFTLSRN